MSKKHLKRDPHDARVTHGNAQAWWYEENFGICVVVEPRDDRTAQIVIPWRSIRAALARKDKQD